MDTKGGFLISQIKQVSGRIFDKLLSESGVDAFNGPQGRILYVLWNREGVSIADIARDTGLASSTLTSMLDRMEASDLIERRPDPNDRRKTVVFATKAAYALEKQYKAVSERMNELYYRGFDREEIVSFEETLLRILENLRNL